MESVALHRRLAEELVEEMVAIANVLQGKANVGLRLDVCACVWNNRSAITIYSRRHAPERSTRFSANAYYHLVCRNRGDTAHFVALQSCQLVDLAHPGNVQHACLTGYVCIGSSVVEPPQGESPIEERSKRLQT